MLQLKLLGVPSLERDGTLLTGRPVQRHRIALLARLALAPGWRLSRDTLIAGLWPERDADGGRNLLKVSTYVLRGALGEGILLTEGDELRLDASLIETDVAGFEAALEQDDPARAVALYRGPFLDGFFLSDAPEFERWVDGERDRLARGYCASLEALAESAAAARDHAAAVEWWQVRAAHDPYDSRVALRLMEALEASGNRAGALRHASVHGRLLEGEFGMSPSAEVVALTERLRLEPVAAASPPPAMAIPPDAPPDESADDESADAATVAAGTPGPGSPPAAAGRWLPFRRPHWLGALAIAAVILAAGAVRLWPRTDASEHSIVVLPFLNVSADVENEFFSDGLTEEIIARLAAVPELRVISRTSAMYYKGSEKTLPQIARELDVDHILEGSVRLADGRVRISAQLIDARVDSHLWAETYEDALQDAFRVQESIAQEVVDALEVRLGTRARRLLVRQGTRDPEAYQLHQRARFVWNTRTREGHERAIEYYNRAIERDSSYADAYAGLAHTYLTAFQLNLHDVPEDEVYGRVQWAAERALALDDESADAHVAFAIALQWQRNWPGAAREYRRAIELNPGHATAHSWYSLLLRGMRQSEDALRASRRAFELDPFGVVITHNYGWQCYLERDVECAIEQFNRSVEVTPYPGSYRWLGMTYALAGRGDEAIAAVRRAVELAPHRPDFLADLAYVQALSGRTDEARATLREAKRQPMEAFNIGRAHVALGEPDSAFVWLEHSNWRWPHRAPTSDPALDPLRADARFARLVLQADRENGMR